MESLNRGKRFLIVMSALVTTAGWAGGSDGAGGDNPSYDHDSAWFVGKRQIQVCLESAKNE